MNKIAPYTKALVGSLIAGLGSLYQALDNDALTGQEIVAVAIAALTALGVVYGIPNADPRGTHQDQSVLPPERGETGIVTVLAVVALVLLILVLTGVLR